MTTPKLEAILEAAIDKSSALHVIRELETVLHAKAEHIRENWQDEALAKAWESVAVALEKAESTAVDCGI